MIACLAPNGMMSYRGDSQCTRLLVGTARGVSVLERAPGKEWSVTGTTLPDRHISSLVIEPVRGGIYAGVHRSGGVFYSPDQGRTWEARGDGLRVDHVFTLLATVENGEPVIYAGTEPVSFHRSRDEGRHWEELPWLADAPGKEKWMFPMPPHIPHVKTMTFDPRDPKRIYAGVEQGGLFVTDNGGTTWRELDEYSKPDDEGYRDIHQIVLRPNHPDELYMTTGMGLYRSTNAGETWQHMTQRYDRVGYPDKLIFSPVDDRTVYMCGSHRFPGMWISEKEARATVQVSHDLGETWESAAGGLPDPMKENLEGMCMHAWPGGFSLFAGTTDGTVYTTEDGGANWREIANGLGPVSKVEHYKMLLPGYVSARGNRPRPHA